MPPARTPPLLLVEDSVLRHERFRLWLPEIPLSWAADGPAALLRVERELRPDAPAPFLGVLLDIDLDPRPIGPPPPDRISGVDVARALTRHAPRALPVLVHSMNPEKAALAIAVLEGAGFDVTRAPFSELDALAGQPLRAWVERCVAALADEGAPP